MKITLHSQYPYFTTNQPPKLIEWVKTDEPIHAYINNWACHVRMKDPRAIAILIEPRSIQPKVYEDMKDNWQNFRYIFTHDSEFLKLPNAKRLLFGGVWESEVREKTKNVSMIASNKTMCPLHIARSNLARQLENKIDTFGNYKKCPWISTADAHSPYRFAIAIENYIDDYYFTEKICNCFANKTVPVYYGARKISEFFNHEGIITIEHLEDVPLMIDALNESEYNRRIEAVEDNFERVKGYYCFEDQWFNAYRELLEGMQ